MASKYLIETTETYRVNTEGAAAELINDAKKSNQYVLKKYSSVKKEKKAKGEVVDEWFKVTLVKSFDDEKDPLGETVVEYKNGAF